MSDLGKDGWPSDTTVIRGRDREIESLRSQLADLEAERALLVTRAENAEAALVAEVAKNGRHAMRVTIAQLEARLQKVMARCADLLDEDQFNELDAIASSASGVQYKPCEICTTQSWCETHGCQCYPVSAVQPERCCVDYPRCDCNSPAEWPTREEAEKRAAELMAIGRATLSRSKHTPECSYWDGLMAQVCNCGATGHTSGSAL